MSAGLQPSAVADALHEGRLLVVTATDGWLALGRGHTREALLALPGAHRTSLGPTAGEASLLASLLPPLPLRAQRMLERLLPGPLALRIGSDGPVIRWRKHAVWAALEALRDPVLVVAGSGPLPPGCDRIEGEVLPAETRVSISGGQAHRIEAVGMLSAEAISTAAHVHLLCVCSGNTCRSPMLEGLLRKACQERGLDTVDVHSAGTFAASDQPASDHTLTCLHERGIDASSHRSRHIDDLELPLYDRFICMTRTHATALAEHGVPADRITLADPNGVGDPFGGPLSAYEACAATLEHAVLRQLETV